MLWISIFALLSAFLEPVNGQRAVLSLGKRMKHRLGKSKSEGNLNNGSNIQVPDHGEGVAFNDKIDLAFEGLKITLSSKRESKVILDGSIRGRAQPGRMLAIMGPSGAGKSTVLQALAGKIKENSKLSLEGQRYLNGIPISGNSPIPAALIEQDVQFFPHMTVRETLSFRVELELGSTLTKSSKDEMVEDLLTQLGLTRAANTIIGDSKVRGISGGERKRLSIAMEMISSPSTILLDEPTSGLDSSAATSLIMTLRNLADSGKTVIAVIHQPSQHVFAKFDDILLVSEGKQMYFGPRTDVRDYMELNGCRALTEMGTAEHILDCISRSPIEDETEEEANKRMENLVIQAQLSFVDLGLPIHDQKLTSGRPFGSSRGSGPKANLLRQFFLLFNRSLREVFRGKVTIVLKLVQQLSTACIYGGIYSLGTNQSSIQDRIGLLSLITIGSANLSMAQTIRSFPREKAIVSSELANHLYRTLPYFAGKAISELPMVIFLNSIFGIIVYRLTGLSNAVGKVWKFLGLLSLHGFLAQSIGLLVGAISPNSDVALALFPAIIVLNIIFDGKNIAEENIPKLLSWIPKVGLIRWGFEGLCVNEFEGLEFESSGPQRGPVAKTGADALARFGLGSRSLADVARAQLFIAACCWTLSFLGLTLTRQKYLFMKEPRYKVNKAE